jgi:hypothetical protein
MLVQGWSPQGAVDASILRMPAANVVVAHLHGPFQTVSRRGGEVLQ